MVRTKLWYATLLIAFFLFSTLYNTYVTYLIFLIMLILPIIMWIMFFMIKRYVDIRLDAPLLNYTKGVPYEISIQLTNRSILPIARIKIRMEYKNQFAKECGRQELITSLDAKGKLKLNLSVTSDYCGMCEYQIKKVIFMDYMMLFSYRKKVKNTLSLAILPPFQFAEGLLAKQNPGVLVESTLFSSKKSGDDPSELYGIRTYEQGDQMNRIHWKLSMKQDELMIKQFGLPINCAVAVMADFYDHGQILTLPQIDAIVEAMFQLSFTLITQEQIHYLIWYDCAYEECVRFQISQEEDCYEAASRFYHSKINALGHTLADYHEAQYPTAQYTNIFYVATELTEELISSLSRQRRNALMNVYVMEQDNKIDQSNAKQEIADYDLLENECLNMGIHVMPLHYGHVLQDLLIQD